MKDIRAPQKAFSLDKPYPAYVDAAIKVLTVLSGALFFFSEKTKKITILGTFSGLSELR